MRLCDLEKDGSASGEAAARCDTAAHLHPKGKFGATTVWVLRSASVQNTYRLAHPAQSRQQRTQAWQQVREEDAPWPLRNVVFAVPPRQEPQAQRTVCDELDTHLPAGFHQPGLLWDARQKGVLHLQSKRGMFFVFWVSVPPLRR